MSLACQIHVCTIMLLYVSWYMYLSMLLWAASVDASRQYTSHSPRVKSYATLYKLIINVCLVILRTLFSNYIPSKRGIHTGDKVSVIWRIITQCSDVNEELVLHRVVIQPEKMASESLCCRSGPSVVSQITYTIVFHRVYTSL